MGAGRRCVLVGLLAMIIRRGRMLFCIFVLPKVVLMSRLMVMMRSGVMGRGGVMMVLSCRMFG